MRTAILLGATGLVGRELLRLLLQEPSYSKVRVIARRPTGEKSPKLEERLTDLDRLAENADALRGDDLFICLGTTIKKAGSQKAFEKVDLVYPREASRLASQAGVKKVLAVSSIGADARSRVFYSRTKGRMEQALASSGIAEVRVFRPSILTGDRAENRPGERFGIAAAHALSFVLQGPLRKYRAIEAQTVALAMLRAALEPHSAGVRAHESDEIERLGSRHGA